MLLIFLCFYKLSTAYKFVIGVLLYCAHIFCYKLSMRKKCDKETKAVVLRAHINGNGLCAETGRNVVPEDRQEGDLCANAR